MRTSVAKPHEQLRASALQPLFERLFIQHAVIRQNESDLDRTRKLENSLFGHSASHLSSFLGGKAKSFYFYSITHTKTLENFMDARGIERAERHVLMSYIAMLAVALCRIQHGVTESLSNVKCFN